MDNGAKLQPQNPVPPRAPMTPRVSTPMVSAPKKRRKAVSLDKRKARSGWLFVLPFVLGLLLVYLPVIAESFRYSLSSMTFDSSAGFVIEFIGLENYQEALFVDPDFVQTLLSGIKGLLIDIPAIVIFSLFIAVILNQKVLGRAVFRTIFFIPVICATGIMGTIASVTSSYNEYYGDQSQSINTGQLESFSINADMITMLFENMKIGTEISDVVISAVNGISSIIERSGVQMLIFLAALQSISPAIYESCAIDGATTWETFWKITFPMISPMILVNAIYTIIDSFTSESNVVMRYITNTYNTGGGEGGQTVSAAMAWMYFGVIILIVLVVFLIMKAYIFYQRRD